MKRRWIAALLLAVAGCAQGSDDVTMREYGSSRKGDEIAVAARLEAVTTSGPIRLRITFFDSDDNRLDTTTDSLPYCTPATECWWAASFPVDQFDGAHAIRRAEVEVVGDLPTFKGSTQIEGFDLTADADGRIRGTAPGDEGYVYVVAFDAPAIVGGVFTSIVARDQRRVIFGPSTRELLGEGSELRGYFYATQVPQGR